MCTETTRACFVNPNRREGQKSSPPAAPGPVWGRVGLTCLCGESLAGNTECLGQHGLGIGRIGLNHMGVSRNAQGGGIAPCIGRIPRAQRFFHHPPFFLRLRAGAVPPGLQ